MAPVVRIDDDVWEWLKSHARPLEDTPNSVLRRVAGLDHKQSVRRMTDGAAQTATTQRNSPRAIKKSKLLDVFLSEFKAADLEVKRVKPRSNLFETRTQDGSKHLWYIKERSDGKGFWGLTPDFLDLCRGRGLPWRVVLLIGPGQCGYSLTPEAVEKNQNHWSTDSPGQYKVHERDDELKGAQKFDSYGNLVVSVLADVMKGL